MGRDRMRVGRRAIRVPVVPSMTDRDQPAPAAQPAGQPMLVDHNAVQHLDRVRAIFRPKSGEALAPSLKRFIGTEDVFRRIGEAEIALHGTQAMMQCPSHWTTGATLVPIRDLEILEILEDQDIRAG